MKIKKPIAKVFKPVENSVVELSAASDMTGNKVPIKNNNLKVIDFMSYPNVRLHLITIYIILGHLRK